MKRIILTVTLIIVGMAIIAPLSAQDWSSIYMMQYMEPTGSFQDRQLVLEIIQKENAQITPEAYHEMLKFLILRYPEIDWGVKAERAAAEKSVVILANALGAAKYSAAANDLRQASEYFDIVREQPYTPNEAHAQQAALIALGDVDGRAHLDYIVQRLTDFNTQTFKQTEMRKRVQVSVIGCIRALETFKDISGYRPVFFALVGAYDKTVKDAATRALPLIAEDPSEVISEIILDPSIIPAIKLTAWNELERTKAPGASRAKVAANALYIGWFYQTSTTPERVALSNLRKGAIKVIGEHGVAGDNVYADLKKSYNSNFISNKPDMDEVIETLLTLAKLKTEDAGNLLHEFLVELDTRKRSKLWRKKEADFFGYVVEAINLSGTSNQDTIILLTRISRDTNFYTGQERLKAQNALNNINKQ